MHVLYGLIKISCLFNLMHVLYGWIKSSCLFNLMHVLYGLIKKSCLFNLMHVLNGWIKISCLFNLMRILYGLIKGGLLFNCMHVLLSHTGWVLCVEQKYDWPMEGFLLAFAPPLSVTRKGAGSSGKSTSEQQNSFLATFLESVIRVKGFDLESRIQNTLFLPLWEITIDGIKGA